jgi:HAD superfamily hydrolase (TIGR01509 family)
MSTAAVVFDMDGLLVHTERQWLQAKTILFERYGTPLTEADKAAVFGADDLASVTYFVGRLGLPGDEVEALRREYLTIIGGLLARGVDISEGATELIESLAGTVPLGLASNTRRELVDEVLGQTPFGRYFGAIATGDEVAPKPAPDVYQLACKRLDVDPATAVAVEDSPTGLKAARAAGLTCIGVPSDPNHPLHEADYVVESLLELLQGG